MADLNEWKRSLYALDDTAFLALMRNYLGPIRTPFNKPDLILRLTSYISREDIRKNIISLLDPQDILILSAVKLLHRSRAEDIFRLFSHEMEYYLLQQKLINMEERLLLFHDDEGGMTIHPLLLEVLEDGHLGISRLIRPLKEEDSSRKLHPARFIFEPPFHLAIYSMISSGSIQLNADGNVKKISIKRIAELLPESEGAHLDERIQIWVHALLRMGTVRRSRQRLSIDTDNLARMQSMPWDQYLHTFIGCAVSTKSGKQTLRTNSLMISSFITVFAPLRVLSERDVRRLWTMIGSYYPDPIEEGTATIQVLRELGVLCADDNQALQLHPDLPVPAAAPVSQAAEAPLIIDSDYSVTCSAALTLAEAAFFPYCVEVVSVDTHYRFQITKQSCISAFDEGFSVERIVQLFGTLTGKQVPSNIEQTMRQWYHQYNSIQIFSGIIVTADEHRRRIIDIHPQLQEHIIKKPAEGVYVFDPGTESIWREVLRSAGMDMLPKTLNSSSEHESRRKSIPDLEGLSIPDDIQGMIEQEELSDILPHDQSLLDALKEEVSAKDLPPAEKEELEARIEKRLIVSSEQLQTTHLHKVTAEAKGFDYQGKLNLCRQAISSKEDLLELHTHAAGGDERITLIRPISIQKDGNNHTVNGLTLPGLEEYSVSLRKVFLLRKLKSSLYTPL